MIRVLSAPYRYWLLIIHSVYIFQGPKIWNSLLNDKREFYNSEEIFASVQMFWVNPLSWNYEIPWVVESDIRFFDTDLSLLKRFPWS